MIGLKIIMFADNQEVFGFFVCGMEFAITASW